MKVLTIFIFLSTITMLCQSISLQLPSAAFSAVAISLIFMYKEALYCVYSECCTRKWIYYNHTEFSSALNSRIYGQPMVQRLAEAVNEHLNGKQPSKALVVALHGPTGTGKNYVVRILAEHLFRLGSRSRYFNFFSAAVHFPHSHLHTTYSDQIRQWVRGNVSACPKSVFVFDEVDKLPVSLLDTLQPFVDYHEHINGVDYRRSIFIFLSNSGSNLIMTRMVQLKRQGGSRHSAASAAEFDRLLSAHVYSDKSSSLHNSSLIRRHLISRFIPFLPLERHHVVGCIEDYLRWSHPHLLNRLDIVEHILKLLPFVPTKDKFFSSAGCKRTVDKTLMVLHEL